MTTTTLRRLLVIGLLALVPLLTGTGLAQAAGGNHTYIVYGARGTDPTTPGTCQRTPFKTIGAALVCVNGDGTTASTPDRIVILPGTYDEHALDVNGYVHITGQAGATTIDAQQQGAVMFVNQGVTVSISGLTIKNGLGADPGFGGGIENYGTLTISASTLSGNTGCLSCEEADGGGILNLFGATLTISNSTLSNNAGCIGGICGRSVGGGIANGGTLTISNSTLSGNTGCSAAGCFGEGGGIYNVGTLRVTNTTLGGKTSADGNLACTGTDCTGLGGGLFNDSNQGFGLPNFAVALTNDTITNNAAFAIAPGSGGGGGGIFNYTGSPTLQNDTIKSNTPDNCEPRNSLTGCTG
jgi:hypothetical protein